MQNKAFDPNDDLFDEERCLHGLAHYLPAQAPLKDFVHHNTLHAFQDRKFFDALVEATQTFGFKSSLSLLEYRGKFAAGEINEAVMKDILGREKGNGNIAVWKTKLLENKYDELFEGRIGALRSQWKKWYSLDPDRVVHPFLFRLLCSYLDQGIAVDMFPKKGDSFLDSVKKLEQNAFSSFFRSPRCRELLFSPTCGVKELLHILVNDESLYEQYLYDQQFSHPGWSGLIAVIEERPETLLSGRPISLRELVIVELLLEIDALDSKFGENWIPLGLRIPEKPARLFQPPARTEYHEVLRLWQECLEWSYYDQVLKGIQVATAGPSRKKESSFQALFCIDDREGSLRRYVEAEDPKAETFGTPGFFGVEFYYQPMDGQFAMKVCPAPIMPRHLVREESDNRKAQNDIHFTKHSHGMVFGYLITHTMGFWSAVKLFFHIFLPRLQPASTSSFKHMDRFSKLSVEYEPGTGHEGLQVGFTEEEMADRVESVLRSIGLTDHFAPLVYVVGHGASSVNNTHYAGYDCGACSGRPGSVNARVFSYMANHPRVRGLLAERGIIVPHSTWFVGCLHDTTRDEIEFYDDVFPDTGRNRMHQQNQTVFAKALALNAKERSRRLDTSPTKGDLAKVHESMKQRSVSLFEPRPELNHATNALCIIGSRGLTEKLFLDRRAFMNSYDPAHDPQGDFLFQILRAAAPVCGGINLEYFFSRVDNQKLGAGSKLPHNVMGLIGVANGIDGDLRPGLPLQMIELHDPLRLLMVVEQIPELVLKTIKRTPELYEWFANQWIHLVAVHPHTKEIFRLVESGFVPYRPVTTSVTPVIDLLALFESRTDNLPVHLLNN